MLRNLMKVSGFTAISRVLGFLRDILIARYLGSGLLGDAFFSAFRFPNLFRRIFGEGAFNSAFVPMFGRRLEKEGEDKAMDFASNAFSTLLVMLVVMTLFAIPFMSQIMGVVVPGFKPKVELPLEYQGTGDLPSRESFSVPIDGLKNVYFAVSDSELKDSHRFYALENLRFVEEKPLEFPHFIGAGERGEVVPLNVVTKAFDQQEQERVKKLNREKKQEPDPAITGLALEHGQWTVKEGEDGRIRLPDGHHYGWFEGELVRKPPLDGLVDYDGALLKIYRNHPETFALTVTLSQITFIYLLFMALVAHLSGVLNTFKMFGVPAAAPILLNVVFLLGLGIFVAGFGSKLPAHVCAWCVAVAGLLQFLLLYGACIKNGYVVKVQKPVLDSSIKRLFSLMGPGVLAAGIQQINLLVGGIIASFIPGAITWLYISDRIYQLPLGMIGIALGVVLLPEVTRLLRRDDAQGASDSMVRGMELGLLVTLPAAVAMIVMPEPIITVLFQRGAFTPDDAVQSGLALRAFALGLPGYVMIKVLQPGYFARENTKAPMQMAGVTVLVNIVVSLLLFGPLGHVGIALGTTVAAWVNVFLLARGLKGLVHPTKAFWLRTVRILVASVAMGVVVWLALLVLGSWFTEAFWKQCIALGILISLGISIYAVLVLLLKATSVAELKAGFRRG